MRRRAPHKICCSFPRDVLEEKFEKVKIAWPKNAKKKVGLKPFAAKKTNLKKCVRASSLQGEVQPAVSRSDDDPDVRPAPDTDWDDADSPIAPAVQNAEEEEGDWAFD